MLDELQTVTITLTLRDGSEFERTVDVDDLSDELLTEIDATIEDFE